MTGIQLDSIRYDSQGLVPAIVQDAISKDVLMLAYMNKESLEKTVATGTTWFWSRSRQELWNKGATSGHTQRVVSLRYDCDADTLLVLAEQTGPACHTGSYTCFGSEIPVAGADSAETGEPAAVTASADRFGILSRLESVIASREAERPEGAYTTYLFEKGIDKILKKVGEETAEVIIAAKNRDHDELRYETSDLIFHLMVLLRESKLPLDDVMAELERRHMSKSK
ncbi:MULTISPECIES: bifunctional phosphoribosyl-AMP cyclohydrolase/phosphoribosyl-ATP diphosphatase HisIE [Paenibacillus]|uniref:bifunctional phosphoribosyl-AMP cyclohydrolase/phosphoribosyl-ATP diphosphatase HisIE n=1 Tax=Paenibacillus TaxID=44249 RepID=UPI00020D6596|nr:MULTISPECIES: bifunctional phosphoribosyl-AMP cyclohydrolase/phosphoribosyl-ATP diphosphatase HisIE [Paenibacillus]EGL14439.1 phosphoribosyl-ATP diphosphatase [Paenibacillus sp. HGF7]EPD85952.1 phosphoribosyl-ATP diphosphatase [Paenibacillus sp. HGH0039]MBV6716312.1 bifunctional phosphoribosyl-AMP cyclohydrolase/phosphoribosyl-ATP diphosphatase HisIE [Paenibacillus chitinolyticus]